MVATTRLGLRSRRRTAAALGIASLLSLTFGIDTRAQEDEPPELTAEELTPAGRVTGSKALTSRVAESDPELLGRSDDTLVDILVKLDYDAVATYQGSLEGLEATSPSVTDEPLTGESRAEVEYVDYVVEQEQQFLDALASIAPQARIGEPLRTVYGGIPVTVPANTIDALLAIPNVAAVHVDELLQLLTDSSPEFIGADTLYPELGGVPNAGEGVIFGVLDSGAWPEHPSFADQGNVGSPPRKFDGTARTCEFGDNPLTAANDPFVCTNKLIGGAPFLDTYLSSPARAAAEPFRTARDSNGHGTHTGSTSAGNALESAPVFGVDRGPLNGIAPGAWVSVYKVCGIQGCFSSDSARAVEQAIFDGVNVINFSISGGTEPATDPVELAFLDAYAAGVFVAASAGNSGPGASTANHLSPWTATVAASTQTREFQSTLTVTGASSSAEYVGASITAGAGPLPIVMSSAAPYSNNLCTARAPAGIFEGKIVACQRGGNGRVEKGYNVLQGGAEGMILYNPTLADIETDNHWLPTVHLADGRAFVAFMAANPGATGQFTAGVEAEGQGDVMAAFSSRGPAGYFIKPDITAPGVQILAGHTPVPGLEGVLGGPNGQYFQAIAGTSMSSPHIAGSAILLKALHPDWTPGQIKSAMMTTAITDVVKEDLTTPADPFDYGSGRVDLTVAGNPGLTFDASAADMLRYGNDPINSIHLNLPSINAPVMPGRVTTTRVATNVTDRRVRWDVEASAPEGSTITVSPERFTLAPGQSAEIEITIESDAEEEQYFGEVRLDPRTGGLPTLHLPVAFVPQQGSVNLMSECDPDEIARREISTCTITAQNNSFEDTTVDLTTTVNRNLRIESASPPATLDGNVVRLEDYPLAGSELGVPSVGPGTSLGYAPLASFGISPTPIGDEEFINYNVPSYTYNGQSYNAIGVNSNGYIVAGGGSAQDNNCCDLPDGPSPARPNNMLAPFWTDLDGTGTPGIRAGFLSNATDTWIVVEWAVDVWGGSDRRVFQTWIGINSAPDVNPAQDITFAYAAAQTDPDGQDYLVGAENAAGDGDMERFLPSADLRVASSDPVPGDSVSYTIEVRGTRRGDGIVRTEMDSELVSGTTVVNSHVRVTR